MCTFIYTYIYIYIYIYIHIYVQTWTSYLTSKNTSFSKALDSDNATHTHNAYTHTHRRVQRKKESWTGHLFSKIHACKTYRQTKEKKRATSTLTHAHRQKNQYTQMTHLACFSKVCEYRIMPTFSCVGFFLKQMLGCACACVCVCNRSRRTWPSLSLKENESVTQMNESCHIHEWVMVHTLSHQAASGRTRERCIYIYIDMCTCVYIFVYVYEYINVRIHIYTHDIYAQIYMCICVYICKYIYVCEKEWEKRNKETRTSDIKWDYLCIHEIYLNCSFLLGKWILYGFATMWHRWIGYVLPMLDHIIYTLYKKNCIRIYTCTYIYSYLYIFIYATHLWIHIYIYTFISYIYIFIFINVCIYMNIYI